MTLVLDHPATTVGTAENRWRGRRDVLIVTAFTMLAGAARFGTAGIPALWNDEAATFRRVCGTFGELSAMLRHEAFLPLHYYLYWLLGQALGGAQHLTPFWMRFIPALAGTLMVPAMWRLARQYCDRRAALLVATLTACSGFLFAYAHDAKMYMPLWLLVTINFSLWISWLREGRKRYWLGWVISGMAMVGYHATGIAILLVEVAAMFRGGRRNRARWVPLLCGLALIMAGPAGYYFFSNDLLSRSRDVGWHGASGLAWVPTYGDDGSAAYSPMLEMGGSLLTGYGWPGGNEKFDGALEALTSALLIAAAGGALCGLTRRDSETTLSNASFGEVFAVCFWIVAPLIAAWRLSQSSAPVGGLFALAPRLCFSIAGILLMMLVWRQVRRALLAARFEAWRLDLAAAAGLALLVGSLAGAIIAWIAGASGGAGSVWVPRYVGFIWPALALAVCASIWNLRPSWLRCGVVAVLIGVNLAQSAALVLVDSEPPVGWIASDAHQAQNSGGSLRAYVCDDVPSSAGCGGGTITNSVGRYYLALQTGNRFGPRGFGEMALSDLADVRLWSQPSEVARDLRQGIPAERLVVWDYLPAHGAPMFVDSALGADWRLVSERLIPVRCHWTWTTLYSYRRLEFIRSR